MIERPPKTIRVGEAVRLVQVQLQLKGEPAEREDARIRLLDALVEQDLTLTAETDAAPKDGGILRWEVPKMTRGEYRRGTRMMQLGRNARKSVIDLYEAQHRYLDAAKFDAWLGKCFGTVPSSVGPPRHRPRDLIEKVKAALVRHYPPNGDPMDEKRAATIATLNADLGARTVKPDTLSRAINELRGARGMPRR